MSKGWIGVDLDGTLATYAGWKSETHIGSPIAVMVERVKLWLSEGWDVRIFTARVASATEGHFVTDEELRSITAIRAAIEAWCLLHIGQVLPITNSKDYHMIELWDDRCVQVEENTGRILGRRLR